MARWILDCQPLCGRSWWLGLATEPAELDEVYRLRYDVFVTEEGYDHAGRDGGPGRDVDSLDSWCDHLILYDLDQKQLIGTYRAIRGEEAVRRGGFYGVKEFDLTPLAPIAHEILQGSRTCVIASHRSGVAFQYLSYGMELLLRQYKCRYFLGLDSFRTGTQDELIKIYSYVRKYGMDQELFVEPLPANRVRGLHEVPVAPADERRLPAVVRLDLRMGFRVCSPPTLDPEFGCYDLLVLARRERMTPLYQTYIDRIERHLPNRDCDVPLGKLDQPK
jgi:putative hemolysin